MAAEMAAFAFAPGGGGFSLVSSIPAESNSGQRRAKNVALFRAAFRETNGERCAMARLLLRDVSSRCMRFLHFSFHDMDSNSPVSVAFALLGCTTMLPRPATWADLIPGHDDSELMHGLRRCVAKQLTAANLVVEVAAAGEGEGEGEGEGGMHPSSVWRQRRGGRRRKKLLSSQVRRRGEEGSLGGGGPPLRMVVFEADDVRDPCVLAKHIGAEDIALLLLIRDACKQCVRVCGIRTMTEGGGGCCDGSGDGDPVAPPPSWEAVRPGLNEMLARPAQTATEAFPDEMERMEFMLASPLGRLAPCYTPFAHAFIAKTITQVSKLAAARWLQRSGCASSRRGRSTGK